MNLDIPLRHNEKLGPLLGRSSAMRQVFKQMKKAATVDIPILLLGETGTGKDLAAYTIHQISDRQDGPYVPVNLGAFPSEIVASELFGHEKGAFTGAIAQRKGKFEQAKHGTIFLDEIESIDEKTQVSLLRLIEHKKFYRLGGKRRIATDARLTVASNAELKRLVDQGTFRQDLFYRLDVFPIRMPALRKHKDDLPLLIAELIVRSNRLLKKTITSIDQECLTMLENYNWPGNVRELKNVIQRSVLMCDSDTLLPEHFSPQFHNTASSVAPMVSFKIGTPLEEIERAMISHTLDIVDNNRTEAAKLLGLSRRALYNRLRKHRMK